MTTLSTYTLFPQKPVSLHHQKNINRTLTWWFFLRDKFLHLNNYEDSLLHLEADPQMCILIRTDDQHSVHRRDGGFRTRRGALEHRNHEVGRRFPRPTFLYEENAMPAISALGFWYRNSRSCHPKLSTGWRMPASRHPPHGTVEEMPRCKSVQSHLTLDTLCCRIGRREFAAAHPASRIGHPAFATSHPGSIIAFPEFRTTFIAKKRFFRTFFRTTLAFIKSFPYLRVRFWENTLNSLSFWVQRKISCTLYQPINCRS